jgi:hypothetical protein
VLLERDLHVLHSVQHVVLTDTARYKGNRALPKASRMYMVVCIRWGVSLIKTSNYLRTRKGTDGQTDRQTDSVLASSTEGCKLAMSKIGFDFGI